MSEVDDLAAMFLPRPEGPAQALRWRQGVVEAFNTGTLANTINIGGTRFSNVPVFVHNGTASIAVGDVVGVVVIGDGGLSMFVLGKITQP
jgi:hypothetical protein